jgi:hypothetical protein
LPTTSTRARCLPGVLLSIFNTMGLALVLLT